MAAQVEYLADASVDEATDAQLRHLFSTCFTKACDSVFAKRRYYKEPYPHRWVIRNDEGQIVAHVGVHEKQVKAGDEIMAIGGIAEVSVMPECRGRGYVKQMLGEVHQWMAGQPFDFAMLFGDPKVYTSSGYVVVKNLLRDPEPGEAPNEGAYYRVTAMVRPVADQPWPKDDVHLIGLQF